MRRRHAGQCQGAVGDAPSFCCGYDVCLYKPGCAAADCYVTFCLRNTFKEEWSLAWTGRKHGGEQKEAKPCKYAKLERGALMSLMHRSDGRRAASPKREGRHSQVFHCVQSRAEPPLRDKFPQAGKHNDALRCGIMFMFC